MKAQQAQMMKDFDKHMTTRRAQMGTLFPWLLDGGESNSDLNVYRTPLLDFVELYDFVSS